MQDSENFLESIRFSTSPFSLVSLWNVVVLYLYSYYLKWKYVLCIGINYLYSVCELLLVLLAVMLVFYIFIWDENLWCSLWKERETMEVWTKISSILSFHGFSTLISGLMHLFFATATIRSFRVDISAYSSNEEADA